MAELPDHIRKTLDDLRMSLTGKVAEIKKDLDLINAFERMYGASPTALHELLDQVGPSADSAMPGAVATPFTPAIPSGSRLAGLTIRPDAYLGLTPLDAAKKYMALVGHAVHIDEIADAVKRGGAAIAGDNWKEALEKSLLRSVLDVIKVQEATFGLVKFYSEDQIKGLRATRRQAPAAKPKRKRGRPRKTDTVPAGPKLLAGPAENSNGPHESAKEG